MDIFRLFEITLNYFLSNGHKYFTNKWMCNDCPRDLVWLMAVRTAPLVGLLMSKYQLPTAQSIIKITTSAWSVSS